MFVVTLTQKSGYVFAYEVPADRLEQWLAACETMRQPDEGITVMSARLYDGSAAATND